MTECAKAFEDLKNYLTTPPILSKSVNGVELHIYLVVFEHVVNSILVHFQDRTQRLVYYVSKTLEDLETKYSDIEKLALILFVLAKKLTILLRRHHNDSYFISTNAILHNSDVAGQLIKWLVALSEFHIIYQLRIALKA